MTELLTAAQMRAIEQAAIESGEVTGLELMERAGRGVVEAIFEEWPELRATSHRAVVLCGPGNNGGDGFVVARLLKEWGWEVEVFLYGDPEKLPPDARVNYERWRELGATHLDENQFYKLMSNPDLVIDALFGTGLSRPLENLPHLLADAVKDAATGYYIGEDWGAPIVAVDMPTGLSSDTGQDLGRPFPVMLTVTFHACKLGHYLEHGPRAAAKLVVKGIGLKGSPRPPGGSEAPARGGGRGLPGVPPGQTVRLIEREDLNVAKLGDHKYSHGHALILTGGPGKTGAARLAARGALRIGAGLVTLACPQQALWEVATSITAIMCQTLDGAPGLVELLEDTRLNALCLGPGMGLGADTQLLVLAALKASRATVLDADALTRFERNPEVLFDALHENCVLTPHAGEFRRIFPDIAAKLDAPATAGPAYSKVDATREAAARAGCTVLFKGPDTVIADQTGRCAINSSAYDRAAPWLATAGSGDVLAGFITGLLARGFPPMQAAETAAWLHTECALSFGPGLIAEDLPEELPRVFRQLGL
ncbi:NAD(P)H-hydrate dehydratase [Silicimonas sp. MF1-12-2]|uniref:NAD(P)H-hydrate dehydratase n=1 Tax=Silicimonas sp. MF1-12-2 TaxID=3384793 RepID=UPI0039B6D6EF